LEENTYLTASEPQKNNWHQVGLPSLLGATLNILAFGFQYGTGNHIYEIAMINWLRDPTLYPNDPIRVGFARFPSVFWRAVALVPDHVSTQVVLFAVFVATKIIFFYGLTRLARCLSTERHFVSGVLVFFALSPILNIRTPFGYSPILDPIQTQTPLTIALLVYAGAKLIEGYWLRAAVVTAACFYLNAILVVFVLFAFAPLAVADFRHYSKRILLSSFGGAFIIAPWLLRNHTLAGGKYPPEYVPALLLYFPRHLVLSSHNHIDFIYGPVFLCAALGAVILAHKKGVPINWRVELVTSCFAIPVALGVVAGQCYLTPLIATLQFMRADAFLFLYAALLLAAAVYKLAVSARLPYAKGLLAIIALAFVLPLAPVRFLLLLVAVAVIYGTDCLKAIEVGKDWLRDNLNLSKRTEWLLDAVLLIAASLILWTAASASVADPQRWKMFEWSLNHGDSFELQTWARLNTSSDSVFLVPPNEGGFRIGSLRSSWGEWKDGTSVYLDPEFAPTYLNRMNELGIHEAPMKPNTPNSMPGIYRRQSLEHLLMIARENHLQYIVQYADVPYNATPVYSNPSFRVYAVSP
jgi:hypothetical protein